MAQPIKKYVGLSLSFCVKDILAGLVPIEMVAKIVCGFHFEAGDQLSERQIANYCETYWKKWQGKARPLLKELKIEETPASRSHNIAEGIWWPANDYYDNLTLDDSSKRIHTRDLEIVTTPTSPKGV